VRDRPPIEAALPALLEFLRGAVLVAHNAHFDRGFLRAACLRGSYAPPDGPVLCTARLARRVLDRSEVRDVRLATLAAYLRARVKPEHRALQDARATVDVFHGLLERVGNLGVMTIEDLCDYLRSTSDPAYRKVRLVADAPDEPGVYRFLGRDREVLYIGKATRLRERLRRYFGQDPRRRIADLVRETTAVTWDVCPTEIEAAVLELRAIRAHQPRYNRRSKRPDRAVFVKLTREAFPRLSIVTAVRDPEALHVGPLASRRAAQRLVDAVHDVLPLRQCTDRLSPRRRTPPCILKDIGRCGAPCDGSQSSSDYQAVVDRFVRALTCDPSELLDLLRARMLGHAKATRFEEAADVRRRLHDVARMLLATRRLDALSTADEVVATRGRELVLVRRGRLAASAVVDAARALEDVVAQLGRIAPPERPLAPEETAEVELVAAWLAGDGVRLHHADGVYAEPWPGGEALHAAVADVRRAERSVRRDSLVIERRKVAERVG
jgi:DNA polymerase III subunit epsilon